MGNHDHLLVEPADFFGLHYSSISRIVAKGRKVRQHFECRACKQADE